MREINRNQLLSIFHTGYFYDDGDRIDFRVNGGLLLSDLLITEEILNTDQTSVEARKYTRFINCHFIKNIQFTQFGFLGYISFSNCTFYGQTLISGFEENLAINSGCTFKETAAVSSKHNKEVSIGDSTFEKELKISGSIRKLNIVNINKTQETNSEGYYDSSALCLSKAKMTESVFDNSYFKNITIGDGSTFIWEGDFKKMISDTVQINNASIFHLLRFSKGCKIEKISVDNIGHDTDVRHRYFEVSDNSSIGKIDVKLDTLDNVRLSNINFSELLLRGVLNKDSQITVLHSTFGKISFSEFIGRGKLYMRNLQPIKSPVGAVSIIDSDLGEGDFFSCKFDVCVFEFKDSKIKDCFFADTDFPTSVYTGDKENYKQGMLFFSQLRVAFEKQGDSIRTHEHHAREVRSYYKTDFPISSWGTVTNLFLNRISNNFGRSWRLGIIFSFVVGFLFFEIMVSISQEYYFSLHFDTDLADSFLRFMNPFRSFDLDKLFGENVSFKYRWVAGLLDFLGRVLVTYGYYQTIQAFRKYGKS